MRLRICSAAVLFLAFTTAAWAQAPATPPGPQAAPAVQAVVPVPIPPVTPEIKRHYETDNLLFVASTVWGFLVPALILFSGFSAKLRDWAKAWGKYWYFTLVIYFALFWLISSLLYLPLDYYSGFVVPHDYGLSSQTLSKWIHDEIVGTLIGIVGGALFLWIPYLLLKRSKKRWWLYTWFASIPVMLFVILVQPIWVAPLFNHFGPMQDKALETKILALADRAGIEGANVYEVNKSVDTNELNAYVTGLGDTKRIVLWDTIIKQFTPDELMMVMGHEMGHYVLNHVWKGLAFFSVVILVGLGLIYLTADWVLRHFGPRIGFTELGDFASLPLLLLMFSLFIFVFQPGIMAFSRHQEHEADRFGLEITHDNHACAMTFVHFVEHDLSYPTPGPLHKLWLSSHPTPAERITFCNDYHPWTEGKSGRYWMYFKPAPAAAQPAP